ncbi:Predicted membrane protein (associated with esophageal cancer in humans) [Plasmopara halstedii]|uniref:Predicted membrane protein (Associated with esophageal cancer in humans) n=1 Tax=Plasmopara halstedii TaxID=4781 RepID=A0A0P1A9N7_PLAHL|nr:Predicted membrane protein (associated with esophageal cancer in humans) [Plasmopara halstedii]CEG36932.1 Predicted membrane protein (associated with esophageal cancer in humans) [Plasmopara halstedii]|eukprot:XP_024573301.1 Predicted membrane protein (associated with esophageal cancer in humans) [Plasmopara halstedii]
MPESVKSKWKQHTNRLLAKYTNYTFKIQASMLEVNDLENKYSFASRNDCQHADTIAEASVIAKTRARLKELEQDTSTPGLSMSPEQDERMIEISQSQYVIKIKEMENRLTISWENNQKVEALRVAIKCIKLLADTNIAPQFRIRSQASEDENGQPLLESLKDNFMSSDINIQAKETCRNWFYKTACIRELLPRIYIEISLLRCYRFLCDGEYPQIIARLSNMIKGVGDPMVALYTRLYLALTSSELLETTSFTELTSILNSSLLDYFYAFNWFRHERLQNWLLTSKMKYDDYLALHSPAIEWLFRCAAPGATQETFDSLVLHYQEYSNSSMILKHLCECFGGQFYASIPGEMLELICAASPSQVSKCHLCSLVAVQLSNVAVIASNEPSGKLQFLNDSWSFVMSQDDTSQYMECAAAFMKLIVVHFSHREALILLEDVVRHLNAATIDALTAKTYNFLGTFIENVVYGAKVHFEYFDMLIPSTSFLTLMDMFKRDSSVDVAKKVLRAFVSGSMRSSSTTSGTLRLHVVGPEAALAHTLLVVCCRVHDALSSLSTVSQRDEATRDISAFITRLGYVKSTTASERAQDEEMDALLMLYTDCRQVFFKLEQITRLLSSLVLRLAMHAYKRLDTGGHHKTSGHLRRNFIRSCLAFAHITIPSIESPIEKLELLVLAANIAQMTNCIMQMDALLKLSIVLVAELDMGALMISDNNEKPTHSRASSEDVKVDCNVIDHTMRIIANLMSVLVYAPSLHDEDAFYFVTALHKAVMERQTWNSSLSYRLHTNIARVRVRLMFVQLYALWGQESLPCCFNEVVSNDVLYGGDNKFSNEVQKRFSSSIETVTEEITALSDGLDIAAVAAQVELMLDFVNLVLPVLNYDKTQSTGASDSSPKQPKSRSGFALIRKCMIYTYEKLQSLKLATPTEIKRHYFNNTRDYVIDFMQEMFKRSDELKLETQAIQRLLDVLGTLALE